MRHAVEQLRCYLVAPGGPSGRVLSRRRRRCWLACRQRCRPAGSCSCQPDRQQLVGWPHGRPLPAAVAAALPRGSPVPARVRQQRAVHGAKAAPLRPPQPSLLRFPHTWRADCCARNLRRLVVACPAPSDCMSELMFQLFADAGTRLIADMLDAEPFKSRSTPRRRFHASPPAALPAAANGHCRSRCRCGPVQRNAASSVRPH